MKLSLQASSALKDKVEDWLRDAIRRFTRVFDNAGLGFGDGTNIDNMFGVWISYTTNATPNTEDTIAHNLGFVPVGFLIVSLDKGAVVYKGTTSWTTTSMYLKCNTASTAVVMFVLGPSNQLT